MRRLKKLGALMLALLMVSTTVLGSVTPVSASNSKYLVREYSTGYNSSTEAILRMRVYADGLVEHYNPSTATAGNGWGQWAFCVEHGVSINSGSYTGDFSSVYTSSFKNAARAAYLGFYRHPRYLPNITNDGLKKYYSFTQILVWQILGQEPQNSSPASDYGSWKNSIMDEFNKWDTQPSFDAQTITSDLGQMQTLNDTNGVLQYYDSFNYTKDGVTFSHTKGSNSMTVKVSENCTKERIVITDADALRGGMSKYENVNDTDVAFYIQNPTEQDFICSPGYNDPRYMRINVNVNLYGNVEIGKKDNKGNYVPNTQFKLSYNSDMSEPIGTYTTKSNGKVTVEKLKPKTVYIQEVAVPEHLILDTSIKSVTVKPNETISFEATNNWKQGRIQVTKKDAESGKVVKKAGTIFDIYNKSNIKIASITTNSEGVATSDLLDYGTYYVKESTAPNQYTIKVEVSEDVGVVEDQKTYSITVLNTRVKGTVNISKEDTKTGKQPQGEATLEGAKYGLYARSPIVDPADGTVIYNTDVKVAELITNSEANASISDLYLGQYYLKEIEPSYGYTLDTTRYDFDLTYENQNQSIITKNMTVKERVISQPFQIIKISSDEAGESDLLAGAEFTIKAQKDIDKFGSWEKAPVAKNADGGTCSTMVTDSKGHAVSQRLPIGTYVVRETKVPDDKYKVDDFIVKITEDSSEAQTWRVFNDTSFKSVLAIVKQDAESGKVVHVEGATFKIKNTDTGEYFGYWEWFPLPHYVNTWTTDESGSVMTGDKLEVGNYQIEEIKSPEGYLLSSTPIPFRISSSTAYEVLPDGVTPVITVIQTDVSVKGRINVEKRGQVLTDFQNGKFVYEEQGLTNATYEIFAKEDILDPSNDDAVLFKKGTIVDTITTGTNGKATSVELPLGEYSVRETKAPDGFVINKEIKDVSLVYKDQNTAIVFDDTSFVNERQKVDLNVIKKDADEDVNLVGAEFGLYAKNNIVNNQGTVVVKAGELIEKVTSDVNGKVHFTSDLPLEHFEIKEIQPPIGYSSSDEVIQVNATYQGQDIDTILLEYEFKNEITKVEVSKQDITDESEIANAHLTVFEKEDPANIFETWISGQDGKNEDGTIKPHILRGLEVGKTYILRETSSPHGFAISQDVEFTVEDTGKIQKVKMKDEVVFGQLKWNKAGEIFNQTVTGQTEFGKTESPVWNKSNLLGAEITIYANEDIIIGNTTYYHKGDKVDVLESDWDDVTSKKLPVGHYYYVESKVPHGYIVNTDKHYFEVEDTQVNELQVIISTLANERAKVNIDMTKILEEQETFVNKDAYKDITFGVFAREDIYDYFGKVAIENGTMIYTSGINEDGTLTLADTFDLPNGVYYIQELSTNGQYILNDNQYDFEISYHGQDVAEYTIQINEGTIDNKLARGTIQVQKVDTLDSDKKLENVKFNISINEDMKNIITTVKTDKNGIATFDNLELGTYFIQEAKQVDGYLLNDHIYKVEVTANGDVLTIECENQPTEMTFSKVDETGVKELPNAEIEIIDKETGEVVDKWTSTEESHVIHYLVEGKEYIMREISAPYGYSVAEEITFVAGSGNKITMKNMPILKSVQIEKLDKDTEQHIKSNKFVFVICEDKECTKVIRKAGANEYQGTALFDNLRYGVYYIREYEAPTGYLLSDQVVEVTINDKGVFADGKSLEEKDSVYSFVYYNSLKPIINTSDATNITLYVLLGTFSVLSLVAIVKSKKKKEQE